MNILYGDIRDWDMLREVVSSVEEIYHLAAMVDFTNKNRNLIFDVNVGGTSSIINMALEYKPRFGIRFGIKK